MNKKYLLFIFLLLFSFSYIIYNLYSKEKNETTLYVLQVGAYQNYDNVSKNTKLYDNYLVYEEDGLYKIFIGMSLDNDIYDKIKNTYADQINTLKRIYKISDSNIIDTLKTYDEVIKNTSDTSSMNLVIKEELKLLDGILKENKIS